MTLPKLSVLYRTAPWFDGWLSGPDALWLATVAATTLVPHSPAWPGDEFRPVTEGGR
jgi:hypothetical protein